MKNLLFGLIAVVSFSVSGFGATPHLESVPKLDNLTSVYPDNSFIKELAKYSKLEVTATNFLENNVWACLVTVTVLFKDGTSKTYEFVVPESCAEFFASLE